MTGHDTIGHYSKRLAIVVPYRNRPEHLKQFIPHIFTYFERDKLDRQISFSVHIVEQKGDGPFNRGKVKNVGFSLVRHGSDYVCFHDVDYLPVWADYSWNERPTRLIWHGLVSREKWDTFFGGVTLFDNSVFERVNGYPNCYWGWGPEDRELGMRCCVRSGGFEKRDGTFLALQHKHEGFVAPGVWSDQAKRTHEVFDRRKNDIGRYIDDDGLSSLKYELIVKKDLPVEGPSSKSVTHYLVEI